jgi:RimJ/RimL family protein N-acetyltransferase
VDPVTLETERLLLRAFAGADAESVYAACQDPDIQYYTPAPTPYLREDAKKYVGDTAPKGWATYSDHILGAFRAGAPSSTQSRTTGGWAAC